MLLLIAQVAAVSLFTMLIHMAETLTYSLRLAGVRLRKLAVAMSLSGIVLLISRTSNMIQAPMTGKIIDGARLHPDFHLAGQMRFILAAATAGTLPAIVLFPTAVRLSARLIAHMEQAGSIPRLLPVLLSPTKMRNIRYYLRLPRFSMFSHIRKGGVPYRLVLLNGLVTAIYTIGVLAALLASTYATAYSTSASQASGLINGMATIMLALLIDPKIGLLTDQVMSGDRSNGEMSRIFGVLMLSRLMGTVLAQLLLVPAALWIGWIVSVI
ncbi:lipid II flippase Amj family protein [Paenibacillus humicus]|uniref:lipid II flippase Amj family protein n=1 Tax=Paenibacillus humicus TaxID=412861 RepID=UPI0027D95EB3|nr:lipid II flippase Amj family protein [Paenibacillus humicus]